VLNWSLAHFGLGPVQLLYTNGPSSSARYTVFLPMMVLPLSAALGKINPAVEEAARTLGAPRWDVFRRVTLPLSVPGLAVARHWYSRFTASSFVNARAARRQLPQDARHAVRGADPHGVDWPLRRDRDLAHRRWS